MERDRDRWLELDSSALNYFFLDIFVDRFPESRFVLTLREPLSWLDSVFNQFLQPDIEPHWQRVCRSGGSNRTAMSTQSMKG